MNHDELFTSLHAGTANDLDGALDIEAGLREALVTAQHTRTRNDLDLDIETGLRAIAPTSEAVPGLPSTHPPRYPSAPSNQTELLGAVANALMSLDGFGRLAIRNHPAVLALAVVLETANARSANQALTNTALRALARVRGLATGDVSALDLDLHIARVQAEGRARILTRALDCTRALARDLARTQIPTRSRSVNVEDALVLARNRIADVDDALAAMGPPVRIYAGDVEFALTRACNGARVTAANLDRAFLGAIDLAAVLATNFDLDPRLSAALHLDLDRSSYPAFSSADHARDLDRARHDFTDADLSGIDLGNVSLAGVRWSMATRWPSDEWKAQALLDSRDLGDGTYEIQGGTSNVPLHKS